MSQHVIKLTAYKALSIAGMIAMAVSGATFAATRLACDSLVASLRLQVEVLDRRLTEVMNQPVASTKSTPPAVNPAAAAEVTARAPADLSVQFLSPKDGDTVSQFTDVAFKVSGRLPPGHRAILLIRDPIGQYWSWGSVSSDKHPRVQIGTADDAGREFELGVLVVADELPVGRPTTARPAGYFYSHITIKRK
jgi:hypothetical protein